MTPDVSEPAGGAKGSASDCAAWPYRWSHKLCSRRAARRWSNSKASCGIKRRRSLCADWDSDVDEDEPSGAGELTFDDMMMCFVQQVVRVMKRITKKTVDKKYRYTAASTPILWCCTEVMLERSPSCYEVVGKCAAWVVRFCAKKSRRGARRNSRPDHLRGTRKQDAPLPAYMLANKHNKHNMILG